MATLVDLAEYMTELDNQLPQAISNIATEVAIGVVSDLALITPADTGAAISNWQVTMNAPAEDPIEAYTPSTPGDWYGSRWVHAVDPNVTRAANMPPTISAAALALSTKAPGQDIYITNVVGTDKEQDSYILDLDAGTSPQFIGDFATRESLIAEGIFSNAKLKIR